MTADNADNAERPVRNRLELARLFTGHGVELGVAAGRYSASILQHGNCKRLWSVDRWSDHHGLNEYRKAAANLVRIGRGRCVPLRMSFAEAAALFPDGALDFIYIDGYAREGQEGGLTLEQWWPKLKGGGIFAGHDYDPKWPATMRVVNAFVVKHGLELRVTTSARKDEYPSWWVVKPGVRVRVTADFAENAEKLSVVHPPGRVMEGSPVATWERVILVGNGPGVLQPWNPELYETLGGAPNPYRTQGEWIDSFDQVVRFNWFAIRGFEEQVGTKTTLWSTFGRGSLPRDEDQRPQRAIFIHGDAPKNFAFPVAEAWGISREFFDEVRAQLKVRSKVPAESRKKDLLPSSGLVVALWLLNCCHVSKVHVVGFDHFSKEKSPGHHYWLKDEATGQVKAFAKPPEHDGEAEAEWFGELQREGRVACLEGEGVSGGTADDAEGGDN